MSEIVDSIEASFKELVARKPYRSITVKDICAGAHIGRNTFYKNFRDKRAIVAYLFKRDAVTPFCTAVEALSFDVAHEISPQVLQSFYRGIYENRVYYTDLVNSMCKTDDTFRRVVTRAIKGAFQKALAKAGYPGSERKADFIAHYYGAAQAAFLERWIDDRFAMSVEQIAALYSEIASPHWGALFGSAKRNNPK